MNTGEVFFFVPIAEWQNKKGTKKMKWLITEISNLSGLKVISLILVSAGFSIVCMIAQMSFKRTSVKLGMVGIAILAQVCSVVLSINRFLSNENRLKYFEDMLSSISDQNRPSQYPVSEKSKILKVVVEEIMFRRGFSCLRYEEDRIGMVLYFSSEGKLSPDTFIFIPRYDMEKLVRTLPDGLGPVVGKYLFDEYPFADYDGQNANETLTDFLGHLAMLIEVISRTPFQYEYREDISGYVFSFESHENDVYVDGSRLENLKLSTRFQLQEKVFKFLAIEGVNAYVQR